MRFLTAEQVVAMHDSLLAGNMRGGGPRGAQYEGVDAAVRAVENSYYNTAHEFAAAYALYIVQGHPFADGNKRAASAAMFSFLRVNRAKSKLSAVEAAEMMIELQQRARVGFDTGDLVYWMARRLKYGVSLRRGRK